MFPSNSNYQYGFGSVLSDSEGFLEPKISSMQWKSSHGQWDACKKMTVFSSLTYPSMKLAITSKHRFIRRQQCSFRCNQNRFEGEPYLKTPNRIGETFDREKIEFIAEEIPPHHREQSSKKISLIEIIQLKKPPDRGKVPRNPIFCTLLSENTTTHICFNRCIPISKNSAILSVALNSRKILKTFNLFNYRLQTINIQSLQSTAKSQCKLRSQSTTTGSLRFCVLACEIHEFSTFIPTRQG